jgi:hypothetical protein
MKQGQLRERRISLKNIMRKPSMTTDTKINHRRMVPDSASIFFVN